MVQSRREENHPVRDQRLRCLSSIKSEEVIYYFFWVRKQNIKQKLSTLVCGKIKVVIFSSNPMHKFGSVGLLS